MPEKARAVIWPPPPPLFLVPPFIEYRNPRRVCPIVDGCFCVRITACAKE